MPADTRVVIAGGCDTNGQFRAKRLPAQRFADGSQPHVSFSGGMFAMDLDDALQPVPAGFAHWFPSWSEGYADVVAVPDRATLRRVPWLDRTALVLCDFAFGDGRPLGIAPRQVLRRILAHYDDLGVAPRIAPEYEFTLLRETEDTLAAKQHRDPLPFAPTAQTYGALRAAADAPFVERLRELLDGFEIPIEAWAPEGQPGQYELNIPPSDPLTAADRGFLFKHAVKEIAARDGLTATFMPLLASGGYGNGLHVNQSLWTADGRPATADEGAPDGLSPTFRRFVAGQLATLREFAVLLLPTVNDYKRMRPHSAAGTTISWARGNKNASLRLQTPSDARRWRIEHRTPGATANPYLAIAALLAGGAYGMEHELDLPPARSGNVYLDPDVEPLPTSLPEAIERFERSAVARRYLGEDFVDYYAATRRHEQHCFEQAVTDWELQRYLLKG